jgi:hypothetical protein
LDRLWRKLDALNRELRCVSEAEYLSGLPPERPLSPRLQQPAGSVNNVVLHPHHLPSIAPAVAPPPLQLEPEPELQREPEPAPQQQHAPPQLEREERRGSEERRLAPHLPRMEGTRGSAEGTGREVLLQVRRRINCWMGLPWGRRCHSLQRQ